MLQSKESVRNKAIKVWKFEFSLLFIQIHTYTKTKHIQSQRILILFLNQATIMLIGKMIKSEVQFVQF